MDDDLAIQKYREFVDGLVGRREGALPKWIRSKGWPKLPENDALNAFLSKLTDDERDLVVRIAREARDGGIHDALAFLQEAIDHKKLRLVVDGVELPVSPYVTELFWDWTARVGGQEWPDR